MKRGPTHKSQPLGSHSSTHPQHTHALSSSRGIDRVQAIATNWGLPEVVLSELMKEHTTASYKKGSLVFIQGSPGDIFIWVLSGLVKVYCPIKKGKRVTVDLAGPGELAAFAFSLDDIERSNQVFEACAVTDCKVALLTQERFIRALETLEPAALIHFIRRLNSAWSKILHARVRRLGLDFRTRLFDVLVDLSLRFGVREARGVMIIPELNHRDFAELVGCSRPAVTKLIEGLINDGTIARSGRQYLILNHRQQSRASA